MHLDLWRGLARWSDVGKEATWSADFIFTPDDTGEWRMILLNATTICDLVFYLTVAI